MQRFNDQTELTWPHVSTQLQHRVPPFPQITNSRLQTTWYSGWPPCTYHIILRRISSQCFHLVCCCSHINSHTQVRGHRTGSGHSGAEEYPRKKNTNQRWYTHRSRLKQFMPPPGQYKSEIGSHPTMCQVHTGAYVSLLALGKNDYTARHPRLPRYIAGSFLSLRIRTTDASHLEKRNKEKNRR